MSSAKGYRDLIRESLEKTGKGYDVYDDVLNAADYGVPQNRFRLFFIGVRKDLDIKSSDIFKEIETKKIKKELVTVWEAIKDLPSIIPNPKPNNYGESEELSFKDKNNTFGKNISDLKYNELIKNTTQYTLLINSFRGKLLDCDKLYNHKSRYNNADNLLIYSKLVPGKYLNDDESQEAVKLVKYVTYKDKDGKVKVKSFQDKYFKLDGDKVSKTVIAHLETDGNSYVHPSDIAEV